MADARFLQIHSLHGYPAALINRDDSDFAKRLSYGGTTRTRISSQCLKRHWRTATGAHSLSAIDGAVAAVRSRETVTRRVIDPLRQTGAHRPEAIDAIDAAFQGVVYGEKGEKRAGRQPLLLGEPEIVYLEAEARALAEGHGRDPDAAKIAAAAWASTAKDNMRALRESCKLPGGLASALFGRMVTSDTDANVDAAVHVAHSFTVHAEETESDYFAVVDDLLCHRDVPSSGTAHLGESELTCGLFYGYVVVDRNLLVTNLGGDTAMAGTVADRLVHLIATVSPGAKVGATAPYGYADWMLIEAGDRQPRSLAEAFREPCAPSVTVAVGAALGRLETLDRIYQTREVRRAVSVLNESDLTLTQLAAWAGSVVHQGTA